MNLPTQIDGPAIAVGDLHGQADLLTALLAKLKAALPDFARRWIVFVGDFCDRGPDTRAVLDQVLALRQSHGKIAAVMGNHDWAMAASIGCLPVSPACGFPVRWLTSYGCTPTFRSYGCLPGDLDSLRQNVPPEHGQFLAALPWAVEHREYLFVHAGILQDEPWAEQRAALARRDLSLNRPPWLCRRDLSSGPLPLDCPLTVVSGHVQVAEVTVQDGRIMLDVGGGFGPLAAITLPELRVFQASSCRPQAVSWRRTHFPGTGQWQVES